MLLSTVWCRIVVPWMWIFFLHCSTKLQKYAQKCAFRKVQSQIVSYQGEWLLEYLIICMSRTMFGRGGWLYVLTFSSIQHLHWDSIHSHKLKFTLVRLSQSNDIFRLPFFHHSNLPGPLINRFKKIRFCLIFYSNFRFEKKPDSPGYHTRGKFRKIRIIRRNLNQKSKIF